MATRVIPAVVRDGAIVAEVALDIEDGTHVQIVVDHPPEELVLGPEDEADLRAALEESDRGEGIPWEDVRRRLERFE